MDDKEKKIFDLIDGIDPGALEDVVKDIEHNEEAEISDDSLNCIKRRTYKNIGVTPMFKKKKTSWRRGIISAACIFAVAFAAFNFEQVAAQVKKALYFIPGMNYVLEGEEETGDVYILPHPVKKKYKDGLVTVNAVSISEQDSMIELYAMGLPRLKDWGDRESNSVVIRDNEGNEYSAYSHGAYGGFTDNNYSYYFKEAPANVEGLEIVIKDFENLVVPLNLVRAKDYASIEEMGPTDVANDISITAVPVMEEGRLKVSLISPPLEGFRLDSYADYGKAAVLKDSSGTQFELWRPEKVGTSGDEFYFDIPDSREKDFILTIPYLELTNLYSKGYGDAIEVEVPERGKVSLGETINIGGFAVTVREIERLDNESIRIYVDVHFDEEDPRSLKHFRIGNISGKEVSLKKVKKELEKHNVVSLYAPELSHMLKFNEVTGEAEYFEIDIHNNADKIILMFYEPKIVVRGPWNLDISPE